MKKLLLLSLLTLGLTAEGVEHDPFVMHVIPKCGTHYIQTIAHLLTGKSSLNYNISPHRLAETENISHLLRTIEPYKSRTLKTLKMHKYKVVALVRDPRDALISNLFHMRSLKGTLRDFLAVPENFDDLSTNEQLEFLITGAPGLLSYLDFYKARIGWALNSHAHTIRYEDLVGDQGGGSNKTQRKVLQDLVNYINCKVTPERFEEVLSAMYFKAEDADLDGQKYPRASIGGWKKVFTEKHKALFKKHSGSLLQKLGYEKNSKW